MFLDERWLTEAKEFIRSAQQTGERGDTRPVVIAYHGDGDGCCAAYFLKKFLGGPAVFYWVATPDFDFAGAESHLRGQKPGFSIFLDMPVGQRPGMLEKLAAQGGVFVYDHHSGESVAPVPPGIPLHYLNPLNRQAAEAYPACLFGWELLEHGTPFDKEVLFMGLFTENWLNRVPLFEEYPAARRDLLKQFALRIHASFLVQGMSTTHYALDLLLQEPAPASVEHLRGTKGYRILDNVFILIRNEKKWLLRNLLREIRRLDNPRFILKRVESKMRLSGLLASELRERYPDLVIGVWQRWQRRYCCELRRGRGSSVNLSQLVRELKGRVKLLTGGGHPEAAAFTAEKAFFFEALDQLRRLMSA